MNCKDIYEIDSLFIHSLKKRIKPGSDNFYK